MTTCTVEPCHPAKRKAVQLAGMFLHVREAALVHCNFLTGEARAESEEAGRTSAH